MNEVPARRVGGSKLILFGLIATGSDVPDSDIVRILDESVTDISISGN